MGGGGGGDGLVEGALGFTLFVFGPLPPVLDGRDAGGGGLDDFFITIFLPSFLHELNHLNIFRGY